MKVYRRSGTTYTIGNSFEQYFVSPIYAKEESRNLSAPSVTKWFTQTHTGHDMRIYTSYKETEDHSDLRRFKPVAQRALNTNLSKNIDCTTTTTHTEQHTILRDTSHRIGQSPRAGQCIYRTNEYTHSYLGTERSWESLARTGEKKGSDEKTMTYEFQ